MLYKNHQALILTKTMVCDIVSLATHWPYQWNLTESRDTLFNIWMELLGEL